MVKLSIVIPVYDNYNFTNACLNDLIMLTNEYEVIIVDNGSKDYTMKGCLQIQRAWLEAANNGSNLPQLRYFRNDKNLGFALACNRGYAEALSENVLFLNNDIRVKDNSDNWTKDLIKWCEEGFMVGPTGGLIDKTCNFIKETNKIEKGIYYMSGWCLAASKSTWNKLVLPGEKGPFSSEFGIAYFEDTDLGLRATELEIPFKIQYVPVYHFGRMTSKKVGISKLYPIAQSIFRKKWQEKLQTWKFNG